MPRPPVNGYGEGVFRRLAPLCLAGALVACGGADEPSAATLSTTPAATADSAPAAPDGAPAAGPLAFSAPLVGGGTIELGASAGRPTLLWFWAPW